MIKVLFICLGNICRSPMAEFVLKKMVADMGESENFHINSAATSREEIGNPIHHGTQNVLRKHNIPFTDHRATQTVKSDYDKYDYILTMDSRNIANVIEIYGGDDYRKVHGLADYTDNPHSIADPWYTGNFEDTYKDVHEGCRCFLEYLKESKVL